MEEKKRRTFTSSKVKERYNKKTYHRFTVVVPKGAQGTVEELAKHFNSKGAYIRHLMIKDAQERGFGDISALMGGGSNGKP